MVENKSVSYLELFDSIGSCDVDGVKAYFEAGGDPAARAKDGTTSALAFAKHVLDELRSTKAIKDVLDVRGAAERAEKVVVIIQEALNAKLLEAISDEKEQVAKVESLTEAGANANAKNEQNMTALEVAIVMGNMMTVRVLVIDHGAEVSEKTLEFAKTSVKLLSDKPVTRLSILEFIRTQRESAGIGRSKTDAVKANAPATTNGNGGKKPGPALKG